MPEGSDFLGGTKKLVYGAIAAAAVVAAQEITKRFVDKGMTGDAAKPAASAAAAGTAPAPSPTAPAASAPAPAPAPVVPVAPPAAPPTAASAPLVVASAPPDSPSAPPAAAVAPAQPPRSLLQAVFEGEFDVALQTARADERYRSLRPGLAAFAEGGTSMKAQDWTAARSSFRRAESTPELRPLSFYWRCRLAKAEIGTDGPAAVERCQSEAGLPPGGPE
ncbi:MAG: hypothetical protein WCK73_05965 [Deltaproteobacteria bacterium]